MTAIDDFDLAEYADRFAAAVEAGEIPGYGPVDPRTEQDQRAAAEFLASLRVKLAPIAKGTCDHAHHSDSYVVPGKLKHLIKARKATCIAPCCNRPAANGDADHTIPWPQGPTCEENLGTPCRYHHRNKQSTGWNLSQPEPGIFRWAAPSGRSRITGPGQYLISRPPGISRRRSSAQ